MNYMLNRKFIFKSKTGIPAQVGKYLMLFLVQMACSWELAALLTAQSGVLQTLAKILADDTLFLISYFIIQRRLIFGSAVSGVTEEEAAC